MTAIVVREARPDELDAAGDVVVRAYCALPGSVGDGYLERVRDARGRTRQCRILVAVDPDDGAVVGSVTYVPDASNPFAELAVDGEAGFRMLGVAPEAQGRGIGRALARACIDLAIAGGRTGLAISTAPIMTTAHRMYEGMGFVRAPERDFEPEPGVRLLAYVLAF
jgi:ribosomal protein S18 acetylase RimI-like enzyme